MTDDAPENAMTACDVCDYTDVRLPGTVCPLCGVGKMRVAMTEDDP